MDGEIHGEQKINQVTTSYIIPLTSYDCFAQAPVFFLNSSYKTIYLLDWLFSVVSRTLSYTYTMVRV